jgi:hypothetical protein
MIQIWSCRLLLGDIERSLKNLAPSVLSYQVILTETTQEKTVTEMMELIYESTPGNEIDEKLLIKEIYLNSRDLKDTLSLDSFSQLIKVTPKEHGEIKRNERTGKISVILDRRD